MSTEPPPPGRGDAPVSAHGGEPRHGQPPPGGEPPGGSPPYGTPPAHGGGPYDSGGPYGEGGGPYGGDGPPGGGPYGPGGPYDGSTDPLAGMPPLADSGKRVLARIIDMILVGIVVWLLSWAFHTLQYDVEATKVDTGKSLGQSVIAAVLYTAYDAILISRTGQTYGKRLLNMRVANLDDGSNPSLQASLIRAAVLWLPFAFCCACVWTAICGGWSFFDRPYKQGLHDKAARTVEVSTVG
ncbi:RDD family protein [Streptomyces sp. NPDC001848]|uniref:RDD family protein n=1 Tax=Streptomyces sp. NPDC001848 TaxID=3364618 RepID=UPI00369D2B81